ncbi:MAG TPA: hypothetical protein VLT57_16250 [Bryobacteraceae bacterium]|nr:hypothetical protein [Bryobacteraceae bacterium]
MSDEQLSAYLGFKPEDDQVKVAKFIAELAPARRALYDRMAQVEIELNLWTAGLGPKPTGVIVCEDKHTRHGKRGKRPAPKDTPNG